MALQIGDIAPDFNLPDSDKNFVQLSDLRGSKVLLLFFPLAFTGVCTQELCTTRDGLGAYNDMNTKVLGISVDSFAVLNEFKKQHRINFPLLSDFNKEASTAYGSLYEEFVLGMKGVGKRSAFIVDEQGKIMYAEVLENAGELPDFDKIKAVLAS